MNSRRYQLLGYVVWQGGRWYLRRRLRPARRLGAGAIAAGGTLAAAVLAAKRFAG